MSSLKKKNATSSLGGAVGANAGHSRQKRRTKKLWDQCYYPHWSREMVSPVFIF